VKDNVVVDLAFDPIHVHVHARILDRVHVQSPDRDPHKSHEIASFHDTAEKGAQEMIPEITNEVAAPAMTKVLDDIGENLPAESVRMPRY